MNILMVTNKVKTYSLMYQIIIDNLSELGHNIVWAADFSNFIGDTAVIPCISENITINTNPFHYSNFGAYRRILAIIDQYEINGVICSTPIGGTLARLAAKRKNISPVLYTAHGFLFFKGAPLINRTFYKWVEKWLARYTDALITITNEDFIAANKFSIRKGTKPYLIHGAGIKLGTNINVDNYKKRKEIGVPRDAFLIISAGELNKNKNTEIMVRALAKVKGENIHYIACGAGEEETNLRVLAKKLEVENTFHLLGYRTDISELMSISNAFVMMSFREGLPRSIMEAMDLGLPCIGSDTRGIRDLIDVNKGGYICNPNNPIEFASAILKLKHSPQLCIDMGSYNKLKVRPYSHDVVKRELKDIYEKVFD